MQKVISEIIHTASKMEDRNTNVNYYLSQGYKVINVVQSGPNHQVEDPSKYLDKEKPFYVPCWVVTYVLEK